MISGRLPGVLVRVLATLVALPMMCVPAALAGADTTFAIKASAGKGGTISPSGTIDVPAGGDQTFTITPQVGYDISSVKANKVEQGPVTSYTFTNVQAKGSIKASFLIQSFTVTFSATDGVTISPSGSKVYKYGKRATVTVKPPAGSSLTPILTVDGLPVTLTPAGKTFKYTLTVTGAHVLAASTGAHHTLTVSKTGTGAGTVSSQPAGIACGATCSAEFNEGAAVTLTATAGANSTFDGWSGGGCTGTGTCQVTLGADTTVTATFTATGPVQRTLTVQKSGNGTGTVTSSPSGINCGGNCSHAYDGGTVVTLTANPSGNSTFGGWSGGGCSGTGTCQVTLDADTTVTATFTQSGGGGGLSLRVTDACDTAADGAIVVVHNPNGTVLQKITVGASGTVDLGSFGNPVTFTVGWPNSKGIANAEIQSFVDVPSNLGTFHVIVEGPICPVNDPLLGQLTVHLDPAPAIFGTVEPLGLWMPSSMVFDVHQSDLQSDGKIGLVANNDQQTGGAVSYGLALDRTFTPGGEITITLDKPRSTIPFNAANNLSGVFVTALRKGQAYTLGQFASFAAPTMSGQVPLFNTFPMTGATVQVVANASILVDGISGFPISTSTWIHAQGTMPDAITVPSLFNFPVFTFDSVAVRADWTVSDGGAGKLGQVGFSNPQDAPPFDDRHWTITLDPTVHSHWAESDLVLPSPEFDLSGRTAQGPSMIGQKASYVSTYADALKLRFGTGVTAPAPPFDFTTTFRTVAIGP